MIILHAKTKSFLNYYGKTVTGSQTIFNIANIDGYLTSSIKVCIIGIVESTRMNLAHYIAAGTTELSLKPKLRI